MSLLFANCGDFRVLCKELFDRGNCRRDRFKLFGGKSSTHEIGVTKFIAITPPGYDNYRKFYYSHFITLRKL